MVMKKNDMDCVCKKIVIIIPTYNEKENIGLLITALQETFKKVQHKMNILIVDDNSPDGTAEIVKTKITKYSNIYILTGNKHGLGAAYIRGMKYAIERLNADIVILMDADFSHKPVDIPRLLSTLDEGADVAIGSRYVEGGKIPNEWGFIRKMNSKWGNVLARYVAGLYKIHDCTSGFRAIRASVINKIDFINLKVRGYSFQVAFLHQAITNQAFVREIPIEFVDRKRGKSKLGLFDIVEFIIYACWIRLRRRKDLPEQKM